MANIVEGGPARVVPLVHYDKDGNRFIMGKVKAKMRNGKLCVAGIPAPLVDGETEHEFDVRSFGYEPIEDIP